MRRRRETKAVQLARLKVEVKAREERTELEDLRYRAVKDIRWATELYLEQLERNPNICHAHYRERISRFQDAYVAAGDKLKELRERCPDAFAVWN